MTLLDNPSVSQFLIYKLGKAVTKRKEAKSNVGTHTLTWIQSTIRLILQLAGFGSLTYAGFYWHTIAGLVVAGFSFFVISWLITPTQTDIKSGVDPMANRR